MTCHDSLTRNLKLAAPTLILFVQINHEDTYEPGGVQGNKCIGCAWNYVDHFDQVDAMEVAIQRWNGVGWIYDGAAIDKWDHLHAQGYTHIAPIGGSDDHHGGQSEGAFGSPLGQPTTMVFASNLSHVAVLDGVRTGRTAVLFRGRTLDPLAELTSSCASAASSSSSPSLVHVGGRCVVPAAPAANVTLFVRVAFDVAGVQSPVEVRLLLNNAVAFRWPHVARSQSFSVTVAAPIDASIDRWRAQVHEDSDSILAAPRAMTNHLFVSVQ